MSLNAKHPVFLAGYYGKNIYAESPQILISYHVSVSPTLDTPPIVEVIDGTVMANATISDKGLGEITRCGFYVDRTTECTDEGVYYDTVVPGEDEFTFSLPLIDLPTGVLYVAAFAENAAGRALSPFTAYRNTLGWEGGAINGIAAETIEQVIVGGYGVPRGKINKIYIGKTDL